jgi:hypothetical protein
MKLPRSVSAERVVRGLERLGYQVIRRRAVASGCGTPGHPRMRSLYNPLKMGMLHRLL